MTIDVILSGLILLTLCLQPESPKLIKFANFVFKDRTADAL
jgi:hypothetical protein